MAALSSTGITFSGSTYAATSVTVRDSRDQIDVTNLTSSQKQYQISPLFSTCEAQMDFVGYGPRAGASGQFSGPGVSGKGATVTSSSTTFSVNEIIRSSATLQFTR